LKDLNAQKKRKSGDNATPKKRAKSSYALTILVTGKVKDFCDLVEAGEIERSRLTECVNLLQLRCADVELNAWSTTQLCKSNIIRLPTMMPEKLGRGKKRANEMDGVESSFHYIFTIIIHTDVTKKTNAARKKDTIMLSVRTVPEELSMKKLMAEFIIFRLWLVVRYIFTIIRNSITETPKLLVPIFVVKLETRSTLGKMVKEQLRTSYRRDVQDLTRTFRCSFVWQ